MSNNLTVSNFTEQYASNIVIKHEKIDFIQDYYNNKTLYKDKITKLADYRKKNNIKKTYYLDQWLIETC